MLISKTFCYFCINNIVLLNSYISPALIMYCECRNSTPNFLILVWPRLGLLVIGLMFPPKLWVLMATQRLNMLLQVCQIPTLFTLLVATFELSLWMLHWWQSAIVINQSFASNQTMFNLFCVFLIMD